MEGGAYPGASNSLAILGAIRIVQNYYYLKKLRGMTSHKNLQGMYLSIKLAFVLHHLNCKQKLMVRLCHKKKSPFCE